MIIELFILVYALMSPERLRFVYRFVLIVDLLLSIAFAVLSYFASGQRETLFRKMVEFCGIAYFILAVIAPCIAFWAVPRKRGRGSFVNYCTFLVGEGPLTLFPFALVAFTIGFIIITLAESGPDALLMGVLCASVVHVMLTMINLWVDGTTNDDQWQSLGQYTALGDDVPVVHHTADTPNQ
jgi:hypothetical protein